MNDLNELIVMYLQSKSCKNTRRSYGSTIAQYLSLNLKFSAADMQTYFFEMGHRRLNSPTTLHQKRACLSDFCNFLVAMGFIASNPAQAVRVPKKTPQHYKPLTPAQYRCLMHPKRLKGSNARVAHYIQLAITLGLRRSELISLTAQSYDAQTSTLSVVTGKTGDIRRFKLNAASYALFLGCMIKPYNTGSALGRALKKLLQDNNQDLLISFHCFRATFATKLFEAGTSLATLSRLMGHRSPQTTIDYIALLGREVALEVPDVFDVGA